MALHSLYCADVPLRNCSLTHSLEAPILLIFLRINWLQCRINEHTGQLLVGRNALWPTQPKFWEGHGPPGPRCSAPHGSEVRRQRQWRYHSGPSLDADVNVIDLFHFITVTFIDSNWAQDLFATWRLCWCCLNDLLAVIMYGTRKRQVTKIDISNEHWCYYVGGQHCIFYRPTSKYSPNTSYNTCSELHTFRYVEGRPISHLVDVGFRISSHWQQLRSSV